MNPGLPSEEFLRKVLTMRMPFGKFEGVALLDLPLPYLVWFKHEGFPKGSLGAYLETVYEIKHNGLEPMIRELQRKLL